LAFQLLILKIKILTKNGKEDHFELNELLLFGVFDFDLVTCMNILLSDDTNVLHRQHQAQHNQVSVCTIQTMAIIWRELMFVASDPFHDLMLTLTWAVRAGENNTDIFPIIIFFDLFLNEKVNHFIEFLHEFRAWRN
jgi:hypothetical protein